MKDVHKGLEKFEISQISVANKEEFRTKKSALKNLTEGKPETTKKLSEDEKAK